MFGGGWWVVGGWWLVALGAWGLGVGVFNELSNQLSNPYNLSLIHI